MAKSGPEESEFAAVYVESITIRKFRGIDVLKLELEPKLTLLVGRNNAGKSRVLRALAVAIGALPAETDDLTVGGTSPAEVDVVLAPTATGKDGSQLFEGPFRGRLNAIQPISDDPALERFAWRTSIRGGSMEGFGVNATRTYLYFDVNIKEWIDSLTNISDLRNIVAADLIETRRDLAEEIGRRGSPIRRVLDDLEIEQATRAQLVGDLAALGERIVASSQSLKSVHDSLQTIQSSIDGIGKPSINPIPVRLEELARSVSIDLDSGSGVMPMRLHGAGARSLASLQVQGVLYDRRTGRDGPSPRAHPVSLVEEPEAHLHPQAQFELANLLTGITGQVVVSTHSSHLASVMYPGSIRLLKNAGEATSFKPVYRESQPASAADLKLFYEDDMEALRRLVERPFGELLFASAVVVGDGACERALLPPLLRIALAERGSGVCVIDPGSLSNTSVISVIKFCNFAQLEWFVFADADKDGRKAVKTLTTSFGSQVKNRTVWVHPNENGLAEANKQEEIATEKLLMTFDRDLCESACLAIGYDPSKGDHLRKFMEAKKGVLGSHLAKSLIEKHPWKGMQEKDWAWPAPIHRLIQKLDEVLPGKATKDAEPDS